MKRKIIILLSLIFCFLLGNNVNAKSEGTYFISQNAYSDYDSIKAGTKKNNMGEYFIKVIDNMINNNKFYLEDSEDFKENNFKKMYFSEATSTNLYPDEHTEEELHNKISQLSSYRKLNGKEGISKIKINICWGDGVTSDDYFYTYWDEQEKKFATFESIKPELLNLNGELKNNDDVSDFWGDASTWFGQAQSSGYQPPEQVDAIITTFEDMINVVGTTVIVIATIVLGIRYVIGSVENQTAAKEGLITLFIACIFFFGWSAISDLLYGGDKFDFIFTDSGDLSYKDMVGRIFTVFTYISQFIVVAAIIYVGIKYIFAGATGRAELKGKSVYFIIGIILVFATSNVLSFISDIIKQAVAK